MYRQDDVSSGRCPLNEFYKQIEWLAVVLRRKGVDIRQRAIADNPDIAGHPTRAGTALSLSAQAKLK